MFRNNAGISERDLQIGGLQNNGFLFQTVFWFLRC